MPDNFRYLYKITDTLKHKIRAYHKQNTNNAQNLLHFKCDISCKQVSFHRDRSNTSWFLDRSEPLFCFCYMIGWNRISRLSLCAHVVKYVCWARKKLNSAHILVPARYQTWSRKSLKHVGEALNTFGVHYSMVCALILPDRTLPVYQLK